ncbi:cation:proton antiporter [Streptomyces cyaneus]|uniref:cation:proton antiporter n=1 Tax=Streptomyces cyaneus TaxID=1904 RepID=UPI000FF8A149|nr:cation:proton antiporter [Streptomyces cyaneus]
MSDGAWAGLAVAGVTAAYALGSRRLSATPVTSAIVFTGSGVLIGPAVLDVVDIEHYAAPITALMEAALTLVLFTDAMTVRRRDLATGGFLPGRLLGIGLPLYIAAGWLLAWPLLPELTVWELALVGAILAPTDAAVGKTAMTEPSVPPVVRHGLNAECGLNDGLVLPFFVVFAAGVPGTSYAQEGVAGTFWRSLLLSSVLGLLAGDLGGRLLRAARARGWVAPAWGQIYVLGVAVAAYELAVLTHGSGFIAAWVAGFAFGHAVRRHRTVGGRPQGPDRTPEFAEHLGALLASISLMVFGAVLLGPALEHLTWEIVLYAVLSLTVVRMVPVAIALLGSGLRLPTVAYIGWFGPRGLASVVLALLVVEEQVPGTQTLGRVVAVTVALSILLQGVSAGALAKRYGRWYARTAATAGERGLRESTSVTEASLPKASVREGSRVTPSDRSGQ